MGKIGFKTTITKENWQFGYSWWLSLFLTISSLTCIAQTSSFVLPVGLSRELNHVAVDPQGKYIMASSSFANSVYLWDIQLGKLLKTYSIWGPDSVVFDKTGKHFLVNTISSLLVYNMDNLGDYIDIGEGIYEKDYCGFSSTGRYCYVASKKDSSISLLDMYDSTLVRYKVTLTSKPFFSPDDAIVYFPGKMVETIELQNGERDTLSFPDQVTHLIAGDKPGLLLGIDSLGYVKFKEERKLVKKMIHTERITTRLFRQEYNDYIVSPSLKYIVYSDSLTKKAAIGTREDSVVYRSEIDFSLMNNDYYSFNRPGDLFVFTNEKSGSLNTMSLKTGEIYPDIKLDLSYYRDKLINHSFVTDNNYFILLHQRENSIEFFNLAKGEKSYSLSFNDPARIIPLPDPERVAIVSSYGNLIICNIFDSTKNTIIEAKNIDQFDCRFTNNNHQLLIQTGEGLKKIDILSGKLDIINNEGLNDILDDKTLYYYYKNHKILQVYDLAGAVKHHFDSVNSFGFSRSKTSLYTLSASNKLRLFKNISSPVFSLQDIRNALFSETGERLLTVSIDQKVQVWDVTLGTLIKDLPKVKDSLVEIRFLPDDNLILLVFGKGGAKVYDIHQNNYSFELENWQQGHRALTISPMGNFLLARNSKEEFLIWHLRSGKAEERFNISLPFSEEPVFSSDDKRLILSDLWGYVSVYNTATWELLNSAAAHDSYCNKINISDDNKFFVTTASDGRSCFWNVETGSKLFTLYVLEGNNFIVVDDEGRFDGTENAFQYLNYRCGLEFANQSYIQESTRQPSLAAKLLGIDSQPFGAMYFETDSYCHMAPKVMSMIPERNIYRFSLKLQDGGLGKTILFVNGHELRQYHRRSWKKDKSGNFHLSVFSSEIGRYLIPGEKNLLTVVPYDSLDMFAGTEYNTYVERKNEPSEWPHFYIVSIGISEYKGNSLFLKYSARDAVQIEKLFTESASPFLESDKNDRITSYLLANGAYAPSWARPPTHENIREVFLEISKKAKAKDIILIFYAGHGIYNSVKQQYLLLTADATALGRSNNNQYTFFSDDELMSWVREINAQKRIMILDACNSGSMANKAYSVRAVPKYHLKSLQQLMERSGLVMLCASANSQNAYESPVLGQGILTYSLLQSIKTGSGLKGNNIIEIVPLFQDAARRAELISNQIGLSQSPVVLGNTNFGIGIASDSLRNSIYLTNSRPIFTRSSFQEETRIKDILNIGGEMDKVLYEHSQNNQSEIDFIDVGQYKDSYSVMGRYRFVKDSVILKVFVISNNSDKSVIAWDVYSKNSAADICSTLKELVLNFIKQNPDLFYREKLTN